MITPPEVFSKAFEDGFRLGLQCAEMPSKRTPTVHGDETKVPSPKRTPKRRKMRHYKAPRYSHEEDEIIRKLADFSVKETIEALKEKGYRQRKDISIYQRRKKIGVGTEKREESDGLAQLNQDKEVSL